MAPHPWWGVTGLVEADSVTAQDEGPRVKLLWVFLTLHWQGGRTGLRSSAQERRQKADCPEDNSECPSLHGACGSGGAGSQHRPLGDQSTTRLAAVGLGGQPAFGVSV